MLQMLERRPRGVFVLLDEECFLPRGSEKTFCGKICRFHRANRRFRGSADDVHMAEGTFSVNHYAGDVVYDVDGFLEKNKDTMYDNLVHLAQSSSNAFVSQSLFDPMLIPAASLTARGSKRKATQSGHFRAQLDSLMKAIRSTESHYIRCIKPNATKAAGLFTPRLVHEQLRYSGVLEAIKIRKQGYPFRYAHVDFFKRYRYLARVPSPINLTRTRGPEALALTLKLLEELAAQDAVIGECKQGLTMILYRAPQHRALEIRRERARFASAAVINRVARGFVARIVARKLAACRDALVAAIAARDEPALHRALNEMSKINFELPIAADARALLARLRKEREVKEKLQTAASWDPCARYDDLKELVEDAHELGMDASTTGQLAQVERLLESVASRMEAIRALQEGVRTANRRAIADGLARVSELAREFGAFCPHDEAAANDMLAKLDAESHLTKPVEDALMQGRVSGKVGRIDLSSIESVPLERASSELAAHAATRGVTARATTLIKCSRVVVDMRRAIASKGWDALEAAINDYSGMVESIGGAVTLDDYGIACVAEEVDLCLAELHNHTIIEELTRALKTTGDSDIAGLSAVIEDVETIGCSTDEANHMLHTARLVLRVRMCIRDDRWGVDESEGGDTVRSALTERYGTLDGKGRVCLDAAEPECSRAREEWKRRKVVFDLQKAMESPSDGIGGVVGAIDASCVDAKRLKASVDAARALREADEVVEGIASFAFTLLQLRISVVKGDWDAVPRILGLESFLDVADATPQPRTDVQDMVPATAVKEATLVVEEFCERKVRERLQTCVQTNRVGGIVGNLDVNKVDIGAMDRSIVECERMGGTRTPMSASLMIIARTLRSLRAAIVADDWDAAEAALLLSADDPSYDIAAKELELCQMELNNRTIIAELTEALSTSNPLGAVGAFDASALDTAVLEGDIADAKTLGCVTDTAKNLLACAEVILELRRAVIADDWGRGGAIERAVASANAAKRTMPQCSKDEITLVDLEQRDRTLTAELSLALSKGRASGTLEKLDASTIRTNALAEAIERGRILGCHTEQATFLEALARVRCVLFARVSWIQIGKALYPSPSKLMQLLTHALRS